MDREKEAQEVDDFMDIQLKSIVDALQTVKENIVNRHAEKCEHPETCLPYFKENTVPSVMQEVIKRAMAEVLPEVMVVEVNVQGFRGR